MGLKSPRRADTAEERSNFLLGDVVDSRAVVVRMLTHITGEHMPAPSSNQSHSIRRFTYRRKADMVSIRQTWILCGVSISATLTGLGLVLVVIKKVIVPYNESRRTHLCHVDTITYSVMDERSTVARYCHVKTKDWKLLVGTVAKDFNYTVRETGSIERKSNSKCKDSVACCSGDVNICVELHVTLLSFYSKPEKGCLHSEKNNSYTEVSILSDCKSDDEQHPSFLLKYYQFSSASAVGA